MRCVGWARLHKQRAAPSASPSELSSRNHEIRRAAIVLVEEIVEPGDADDSIVDKDKKFALARRPDRRLDEVIVGVWLDKSLLAADAAVAQHDVEPVLGCFA